MLAIFSDIHDNLANLDKAITWAKANKAKALLILGDLTNSDTLKHLGTAWIKPIFIVQGNCDFYEISELKQYPQMVNLGRQGGVIEISGHKIGLCHEPQLINHLLPRRPAIIFYGHTHIPWEEIKHNIPCINPGNIAGTRNEATFASFNQTSKQLLLHRLNTMTANFD